MTELANDDMGNSSENKNNCDAREAVPRQFYKNRISKNNVKLETEDSTPQEKRRKQLLKNQKKHRNETINAARGIVKEYSKSKNENIEEGNHSWYYRVYKNEPTADLRLVLPGRNPDSDPHQCAAVDFIWIKDRKLFYVEFWSQFPFTNCEAEFRLFWIKSKFEDTPELKQRNTDTNSYPILTLPNIECKEDLNSALMNLKDELHPLDGFLFYHNKALYTFGSTPLVTWLKPYMLPEVLGIFVPSPLDEKPDDYINFEHHMQKIKAKKNQDTTKDNIVTDCSMEIEGAEEV
ncbi:snurportin-1-like [Temnothorax longispinosus]|uniref:snurportin-1-like n=1 Tax=Temnothorax longispinosus TaxID=300112 RepID=UPI003A9A0443